MSERLIEARITNDPLLAVAPGFSMICEALAFPATKLHLPEYDDWTMFRGVLAWVVTGTPNASRVHGSAVVVAPGIAIAATHVVQQELPDILEGVSGFLCLAHAPWGIDIWRVREVCVIDTTDLVLLMLERNSDMPPTGRLHHAFTSTRLPAIGELVAMVGYVANSPSFDDRPISGVVHVAQGIVKEHYLEGRDRVQMPGPCIQVDVGAKGGMSGGPVFDEAGAVIGIVSSSIGEDADGVAFVSLTLPALVRKVQPWWPLGMHTAQTTLLEFAGKLQSVEKPDAITPNLDRRFGYLYTAWS